MILPPSPLKILYMTKLSDLAENKKKLKGLKEILEGLDYAVVALSGGVDSGFLLAACAEFMDRDRLLAVTSSSPIHPPEEIETAKKISDKYNVEWRSLEDNILENAEFTSNSSDRCYICKKSLFSKLVKLSERKGFSKVLEGTNKDDKSDDRPGMRAIKELNILSPLKEAGLGKGEIREFAKNIGLPNWNRPSKACLATRFPRGKEISFNQLKRLGQAEAEIGELGLIDYRVRYHPEKDLARIEVPEEELQKVIWKRKRIVETLKDHDFSYITLDLEGYRPSGSGGEKKNNG